MSAIRIPTVPEKIVVTGSAGYIGSALLWRLLAETTAAIVAIDRDHKDAATGRLTCLRQDLAAGNGVERVTDLGDLNGALFFHLAGLFVKDVALSPQVHPTEYERDNVLSTRYLLQSLQQLGGRPRGFILSSTACVYDGSIIQPTPIELARPITAYAESKFLAERETGSAEGWIPEINVLRFSRVIGIPQSVDPAPRELPDLQAGQSKVLPRDIVSDFIERLAIAATTGTAATIGSATEIRSYIHIEDLLSALLSLTRPTPQTGGLTIANVATAGPVEIGRIAEIVAGTMLAGRLVDREPLFRRLSSVRTRVRVLQPAPSPNFGLGPRTSEEAVHRAAAEYCRVIASLMGSGRIGLLDAVERARGGIPAM